MNGLVVCLFIYPNFFLLGRLITYHQVPSHLTHLPPSLRIRVKDGASRIWELERGARGHAGGMDGVGLAWVVMGVWQRGVGRLGSCVFGVFFLCFGSMIFFFFFCHADVPFSLWEWLTTIQCWYTIVVIIVIISPFHSRLAGRSWSLRIGERMFSVLGLGVVAMPVCLTTFFFLFCFSWCRGPLFLVFFSWSFLPLLRLAVRFVSLYSLALHRALPQTAGHIPTMHGSVRDLHRISLVGGASREGGGGWGGCGMIRGGLVWMVSLGVGWASVD